MKKLTKIFLIVCFTASIVLGIFVAIENFTAKKCHADVSWKYFWTDGMEECSDVDGDCRKIVN